MSSRAAWGLLLLLFLVAGCGAKSSETVVSIQEEPVVVVKPGTGKPVAGAGAVELDIRRWVDKYDGKPYGKNLRGVFAWDDEKPLWPGIRRMLEGAKEGAVLRTVMTSNKHYGLPVDTVYPDVPLYYQVKVIKVFPPEPVKTSTVKPGKGDREAKTWDYLKVRFTGWSKSFAGKKFDSRKSYVTKLAPAQTLPGWYPALLGMKKGELRRVQVPFYRSYGYPGRIAPANQTLYYEIELLDFVDDPNLGKN